MRFVGRFPLVRRKDMELLLFAMFATERTALVSSSLILITQKYCCPTSSFKIAIYGMHCNLELYFIILVTHGLDLPVQSGLKTNLGVKRKATTGEVKFICVAEQYYLCIHRNFT